MEIPLLFTKLHVMGIEEGSLIIVLYIALLYKKLQIE